ncbi:MAG: putative PEP-binding protein, partial [Desulfovibrionaceae bacterium]
MARAILYGTPVSPGIAIGKVSLMHSPHDIEERFVLPGEVENEVKNLLRAAATVRDDLARAREAVPPELAEHRDVIASHMLICQDPKLLKGATTHIQNHCMCAAWALNNMVEALCATFRAMDDPYLRDRAQDIRAVGLRIQARLTGAGETAHWEGPRIGLAEDLSPADALDLNVQHILALVTLEGGPTSHTAILARSLRIPAIVGVTGLLKTAHNGEFVVVDALKGCVYIEPDEKELDEFALRQEAYIAWEWNVRRGAHLPAETLDGVRIEVQANIKNAEEIDIVTTSGAEGVGLYRTEFAYLKGTLPTEEQLYAEYSAVAAQLAPKRVVFRTLDVGADKMLYAQSALKEPNPALGLRAIRFCLRHQNIFRTQLRALLRAGVYGDVALMFPMISGPQEIQSARRIIDEV